MALNQEMEPAHAVTFNYFFYLSLLNEEKKYQGAKIIKKKSEI